MSDVVLNCEVEIIPNNQGDIALSFKVNNPSEQIIEIQYFQPFTDFVLKAYSNQSELSVIQPSYDTGIQPTNVTLASGETTRIETPIYLRFDPNVPPSGGDTPTQWTLLHVPTPVLLKFSLQFDGVDVETCEAYFTL